ncbi:MAG: DUF1743 domain-containing protein [Thermocladium sp.]|jgi:tRNA(Ile2)-agmatinylcytidine synthase
MGIRTWIAFDDTDDYEEGCTTFVMYNFLKEFLRTRSEERIIGLPRLVRLNPYVPFKTRGNAAVAVQVEVDDPHELLEMGIDIVDRFYVHGAKTSPGIVVSTINDERWFYYSALSDVIPRAVAERVAKRINALTWGGRGIIGGLAAIMADLSESTFELLSYRDGERPSLDVDTLRILSELTEPFTFANMDRERPLIVPSTNDPVLFGIRGDSPFHVMYMANVLTFLLGMNPKWLLYETNQGTGAGFALIGNKVYQAAAVRGYVDSITRSREGHALIKVGNNSIIVYRHTGMGGAIGNYVMVLGGRRPGINDNAVYAESMFSINEAPEVSNPKCPKCGSALKSAGKGELKCVKCGFKAYLPKVIKGSWGFREIFPSMGERRHLAKAPERVGLEGISKLFEHVTDWIR